MNRPTLIILAGVLLAGAAAFYLWERQGEQPAGPAPAASKVEPSAPAASTGSETPPIRYPVESLPAEAPSQTALPPIARSDESVRLALVDWLGKDKVASFLQLDDVVRHTVATVDNLGRSHAAPRLWPVNPAPGRFGVVQRGDALVVAPGNAERYAAFVSFVDGVDTGRAVALYKRWYPWFQQAYEELGYPGRYFNDRAVEVIDQLIATPVPAGPVELKLTEVKGPIPSTTPWLRYEFADPSLEALSAGQKMMIRLGPDQQQRMKLKLVELRSKLTATTTAR
jgi:Protein of unknown function (DUF3014)